MNEDKRTGLLNSEEEKFLAVVLDDLFIFKNPVFESLDKSVFRQIIKIADNYGADRIPETWKLDLIPIIGAALKNEKEKVRLLVIDLLNKRIDIPKLDDEQELIIFDSFSKFIAAAIDLYLQKKR